MAIAFWMLVALASTPAKDDVAVGSAIVLVWNDAEGLYPWNSGRVREDVDAIFERSGISVQWMTQDTPGSIRVVLRPVRGARWGLGTHAMGATPRDEPGERAQTIFVFYPSVVETLGLDPRALVRRASPRDRRRLDRATARVVVHEVVHAVAPQLPHRDAGVMRAHLTRNFLTAARDVTLRQDTVAAISGGGSSSTSER